MHISWCLPATPAHLEGWACLRGNTQLYVEARSPGNIRSAKTRSFMAIQKCFHQIHRKLYTLFSPKRHSQVSMWKQADLGGALHSWFYKREEELLVYAWFIPFSTVLSFRHISIQFIDVLCNVTLASGIICPHFIWTANLIFICYFLN